jgi:hypothetical protein
VCAVLIAVLAISEGLLSCAVTAACVEENRVSRAEAFGEEEGRNNIAR